MSEQQPDQNPATVAWPVKILIYLYEMRGSGYVRVTERDLIRQWENLNKSMRVHLTYLAQRDMVKLSAVTPENCYVRLTERGVAFVESGMQEAEQLSSE
ncbi:MAG TPA: hypothetical protein VFZ25_06180 [Chloroflexota bacterium]|nr:hypothetical protein [Chloroflexota bacterium]